MPENFLSIQQYAIKHKLSTFATIKLINQGKIKTIKKIIDGEEREFIMDESITPFTQQAHAQPEQAPTRNYEAEYYELLAKYSALQEKYAQLVEEQQRRG